MEDQLNELLEVLRDEKRSIENKIDSFSRYGRSPNDKDYEKMTELLRQRDEVIKKIDFIQTFGLSKEDKTLEKQSSELLKALEELVCITKIHSKATKNNFAWAELEFAEQIIDKTINS